MLILLFFLALAYNIFVGYKWKEYKFAQRFILDKILLKMRGVEKSNRNDMQKFSEYSI